VAENENVNKCARETCGCPATRDSKYCCEECEDAARVVTMEIACSCHHAQCS
jgi:hypothetical protein